MLLLYLILFQPVRGRGGRRSHSGRDRREDAPPDTGPASTPPATLQEMPETPIKKAKGTSRARKVPKFSPRTAASVAFSLRSHLHLNARDSAEDESGSESDAPKQRKRKPRALNKINHSKSGWRRVGSSHTAEIFKTFEGWVSSLYSPPLYE